MTSTPEKTKGSSQGDVLKSSHLSKDGAVSVSGARQNNLKNFDIDIPRNAFVVFTGISGSGKSSLAFDTIYAESQRRYFESIAPYARRLLQQLPAPAVGDIQGLPPAVALEQRRTDSNSRSTVGTITNLSNSLRMLFSRAGSYPEKLTERLDSDAFSSNTPQGACEDCHGTGVVHDVTEASLVPDPTLSIREKAVAAWPGAWQGKNYRDILDTLGYDVDKPFKDLPEKEREWILFTEEKPVVTVHPVREAHRIQRPYKGTYMSAASYVRHTFATTQSATLRRRVAQFMESSPCKRCKGKRLNQKSLSVKFFGYDIAELGKVQFSELRVILQDGLDDAHKKGKNEKLEPEKLEVASTIIKDLLGRIELIEDMGLEYLSLDRPAPTLSQGEMQRLRLITQLRQGLFSVVYVLDEPSAGLHPADTKALLKMLSRLKELGNSLFVVEHEMDIVRRADWIVDIGPGAGIGGGELIYNGPVEGISRAKRSLTARYLFKDAEEFSNSPRKPLDWIELKGINRNNLKDLDVDIPLGVMTAVTGVSGAGKSTLVTKVLAPCLEKHLDTRQTTSPKKSARQNDEEESLQGIEDMEDLEELEAQRTATQSVHGLDAIKRMVCVDQKPIGRTPRSNLATYTGLFDHIRKLYAAQDLSKKRKYKVGRFSFNVEGGRCAHCEGEGYVSVELLFLPSVYSPCATCHGSRYNKETLEVEYRGYNIAQILDMSVDEALEFFEDIAPVKRALSTLKEIGLGYLKLGQPATELSGGEAQRIKLASELQRVQKGNSLYLLDEPTTGLHPHDTDRLMKQLNKLVEAGNTVIVVEHDLDVIVQADWIIDLGPGAGEKGGKVVASGTPTDVARVKESKTASYLKPRVEKRL